MSAAPPVTDLLPRAAAGDVQARDALLAAVYQELRRQARHLLAGDRMSAHLSPTELVHGAALKLMGQAQVSARDRAHFLAYAGQVMRQVLVDHVRHEHAERRDAAARVTLLSGLPDEPPAGRDVQALHEALLRLAEVAPPLSLLVERRYFAGLTIEQIAELDGTSAATVKRQWRAARAWLHDALN